ncbi:MAG: hypothetical protein IAE89_02745 [Anaerolineae bacterium]|nr:hypothetical protein [Anaerolineae bacterium]
MIIDWLAREGGILISWWLLVTVAGLAALPLVMRLLGGLPDKGYTLSKASGVLLVAFIYWLLGILGFLKNSTGGMLLAWVIVLVIGLIAYFHGPRIDLRAWWRENRALIIAAELLFIALFVFWAAVQSHMSGLVWFGTEKPMDLAFISSIMRSDAFPPNDPWMAGYSISYYYFGYIIAAMLAMLSGIPSTIAFSLMISLLFALTGLMAFGIVSNLVSSLRRNRSTIPAILTGLLAAVFVVILGNYQVPLTEIPYETDPNSTPYLTAIDSNERQIARPVPAADFGDWDYWWFFRGARVLNDRNLDGAREEVIDEFPQFSFLLADVHPHVMALPFAALALGLALNLLLLKRRANTEEILLYAVCFGALIFLNTWDGPIYIAVLVGADGLRRLFNNPNGRLSWADIRGMTVFGGIIVGLSVLFYFPFLASFRSQLGGILPNLIWPTSFAQFFIHFGPLLLLIAAFLLIEAWRAGKRMNWRFGAEAAFIILWLLILLMIVFSVIGWLVPDIRAGILDYVELNGGWGNVLPELLSKRLTHIVTALVLTVLLALTIGRLFPRIQRKHPHHDDADHPVIGYPPGTGFALLLIGAGLMLTLAPEFVYLRDNFGTRMNTIFKFYYQVWLLWSIAAAYGVYAVFGLIQERSATPIIKAVYGAFAVVTISLGLLYPVLAIAYRTMDETGRLAGNTQPLTLDTGPGSVNSDDYAVVLCLGNLVIGDDAIVAAHSGGSYDTSTGLTGRIAGISNLINWGGHEGQWRGTTYFEIAGSREADLDRLYSDVTWRPAQEIIDRYGIDFIMFGEAERAAYGAEAETKFRDRLPVVCESGNSRIYRAPTADLAQDIVG